MKKLNKLLVIGLLFLSASACQQTAVLKEDYISFFNYVLTSGKANFNDSLYNLSLTIDTNSYIDNNTEITYYYLPFMKKYQLYDDEVIKVSDEINYGLDLYKLVILLILAILFLVKTDMKLKKIILQIISLVILIRT